MNIFSAAWSMHVPELQRAHHNLVDMHNRRLQTPQRGITRRQWCDCGHCCVEHGGSCAPAQENLCTAHTRCPRLFSGRRTTGSSAQEERLMIRLAVLSHTSLTRRVLSGRRGFLGSGGLVLTFRMDRKACCRWLTTLCTQWERFLTFGSFSFLVDSCLRLQLGTEGIWVPQIGTSYAHPRIQKLTSLWGSLSLRCDTVPSN